VTRRQILVILLALTTPLSKSSISHTQIPPADDNTETLANYPYTLDFGVGGYDAGQQDVANLKIPVTQMLRSPEEHPWGLRLRVPISMGVYGLELGDLLEDFDLDRVKVLTVVPALEFLIPLNEHWTLKPRQDLGLGKDFHGGELILIAATGVQGVYIRPWKSLVFTFCSGVKYSLSESSGGLYDDDFARLEIGLDTLIPFGLDVGQRRIDFSLYALGRHYFRELVFGQVLEEPIVIEQEYEVGITFGSTPKPRIWKFSVPRLLIGYRFGENLRGIRLKLGLPF
jgi:hypothetical protein